MYHRIFPLQELRATELDRTDARVVQDREEATKYGRRKQPQHEYKIIQGSIL